VRRWIDDIHTQVLLMNGYRSRWRHFGAKIAANDSLPDSDWWPYMRDTYGVTRVALTTSVAVSAFG
jgi:hypothetical protein